MIRLGRIIFGSGRGIRYAKDDTVNQCISELMPAWKGYAALILIANFILCLLMALLGQLLYGSMPFEWQYTWREFLFG